MSCGVNDDDYEQIITSFGYFLGSYNTDVNLVFEMGIGHDDLRRLLIHGSSMREKIIHEPLERNELTEEEKSDSQLLPENGYILHSTSKN